MLGRKPDGRVPSVREKFAGLGVDVVGGTSGEFAAHVLKETVKWVEVVKRVRVQAFTLLKRSMSVIGWVGEG